MRTYYIFNINREFKILTKENPYNLFKTLENIYYLDKCDLDLGLNIFEQVAIPFDKYNVNTFIFNNYKENDFYTMNRSKHKLFNKYKDEKFDIETKLAYIKLCTNITSKSIFENLQYNANMFVCDFVNKDYFWIDKILNYN